MQIKIGDWVKAEYQGDEAIGYVRTVYPEDMDCIISVTQCETHPNLTSLHVRFSEIIMVNFVSFEPEDVFGLIDIALMVRDKAWFNDLVAGYRKWSKEEKLLNE